VDPEYISGSSLLYVSGYALSASPIREAVIKAVEIASRSDIPIFFDPGPKLTGIPVETLERLIFVSRVVLLNEREITLIEEAACTRDSAQELLQKGPQVIVLKRGPEGCCICTDSGFIEVLGHSVRAVDTTGAGDAFNASFVYGYLRGWSLRKSAVLANAVGAVKVTKMGAGVKVPTADEIRQFLSKSQIDLDDF
jgi:sugar/nucleoside kinase (ribokinase family)